MCHACVIDAVKQQMLEQGQRSPAQISREAATAPTTLARGHQAVADLTHALDEQFPTFFGQQEFFRKAVYNHAEHGLNLHELRYTEHIGTHMDAPLHFSADGASVDEIPVGNLVVPLCVIDIRAKAANDADAQLTPEDIQRWQERHGPLPENACVAMLSGWDRYARSSQFRNADADGVMHFPGFHIDAVQYLLEQQRVAGIAVDTLSLDYGPSTDFAVHKAWLPSGRWGIEAVANLAAVPASGATLVVGAPKITGGTGGPARIITLI